MSKAPHTFVKSRENLQALNDNNRLLEKYEAFDRILDYIWYQIRPISCGFKQKTKLLIDLKVCQFHITKDNVIELIEILKEEYPGVDFTYTETAGYEGKMLEQLIIMDWS